MQDSYLVHIVALFLAAALVLYVVLGGADFGAGILELFLVGPAWRQERQLLQQAIGPVWEANHIWLIIALVILFNAFPAAFAEMSTTFHIPLTLMLVGITMRGTAYALRHYDDIRDGAQTAYERFFVAGSILTPLALGLVAGGLALGQNGPKRRRILDALRVTLGQRLCAVRRSIPLFGLRIPCGRFCFDGSTGA